MHVGGMSVSRVKKPGATMPPAVKTGELPRAKSPRNSDSFNGILQEARQRLGDKHQRLEMIEVDPAEIGYKYIIDPDWQRIQRDGHIERIARGLSYHGFTSPVVLAQQGDKYNVVDGCHRFRAILKNGKKFKIAALIYDELTDDEMRELFLCLNSISKSTLADHLRSYRAVSPAYQQFGDGEGLVIKLTFGSPKGQKVVTGVSYASCLAAWMNVERKRADHGRERNALLKLWRSDDSIRAMREVLGVVNMLHKQGLWHPRYYGSIFMQALLELARENGIEKLSKSIHRACTSSKYNNDGKGILPYIVRQTAGALPAIRATLLWHLNMNVRDERAFRFPEYIVKKGGLGGRADT